MAVSELIAFGTSGGGAAIMWYLAGKIGDFNLRRLNQAAIDEDTTDGRRSYEWYELLRDMGREEYEKLSRGALDGLEEHDTYGRWDIKTLLKHHYDKLMMEWYPEKYCKYCKQQGCDRKCDAYWAGQPPCEVCRKTLHSDGVCFWCGYDNMKWREIERKNKERREREAIRDLPAARISTGTNKPRKYFQLTPAGLYIFTENDIQIVELPYSGEDQRVYRITSSDESWVVGMQEIKNFQRVKGIRDNGVMNSETCRAIAKYLDAGNSWPVTTHRALANHLRVKSQNDLEVWVDKRGHERLTTIRHKRGQ